MTSLKFVHSLMHLCINKKNTFSVLLLWLCIAIHSLLPSYAYNPHVSVSFYILSLFLLYKYVYHNQNVGKISLILFSGLILRLLFFNYPLSDDVFRYAFEGKIQSQGLNPYLVKPQSLNEQFSRDVIYQGINHKDVSAIYPPLTQLVFRALSSLHYSLLTYKIFFLLCDLLIMFILPVLLTRWKVPGKYLALYAWNPLIILFFSGSGHLDVMQFLVLTLVFIFFCKSTNQSIYGALTFLALGCAFLFKFLALLFLPFLITKNNYRWFPFFFLPFLAYIPFWDANLVQGLMTFSRSMSYNDFLPKLLHILLPTNLYPVVHITLFIVGYAFIWLFSSTNRWRGMLYVYMWCLFCLPTVHIWYLAPLVLLLIKTPYRPGWIFLGSISFGFYVSHHQLSTGHWIEFPWLIWVTYVPVLFFIIKDFRAFDLPWHKKYSLPKKISIIIPTYNEGKTISIHLKSLFTSLSGVATFLNHQVIVVDGGSADDTILQSQQYPCLILESKRGRGNQIVTGLGQAQGDLILILHSDSIVSQEAITQLYKVFKDKPTLAWGILGHHYGKDNNQMRFIRLLNYLRFELGAIAFGDQGIFFRRNLLEKQGGLPALPLMEDVELSLLLSVYPRVRLGSLLTSSTRRWQVRSTFKHSLHVIGLVSVFLIARRLGFDISAKLYAFYYGKKI